MSTQPIKTRTGQAWLGDDGIIVFQCAKGATVALEDAKANDKAAAEVASQVRRPLLVDMRVIAAIDKEARAHHSGTEGSGALFTAVALLVRSPLSRVVGSIFMGLNKPSYPMRLFSSETKARQWLTKHLP